MYSFAQYKIDIINIIAYLENEIVNRKNNNGYNYQTIEQIILPEFQNLFNYAQKGYIYTFRGKRDLKSVRLAMWDGFERDFCEKLNDFQDNYQKLNLFSGGKFFNDKSNN